MSRTCPSCGAASATDDYCDQCGSAMNAPLAGPAAATPADPAAPEARPSSAPPTVTGQCPSCGADRTEDDVFCEVCGLDFATGRLPAPPVKPAPAARPDKAAKRPKTATDPASAEWVAVIEADRAFFDSNRVESGGGLVFPEGVSRREVALVGDEVQIGRRSEPRGYFPEIDLGHPVEDAAASHRHAVLRRNADGSWSVVDERSTNGTWLNDDTDPIAHGVAVRLADGDRLHVGAFTTITLRKRASAR